MYKEHEVNDEDAQDLVDETIELVTDDLKIESKKDFRRIGLAYGALLLGIVLVLFILKQVSFNRAETQLGINAVKLLYEFRSVDTLQYQQTMLKKITTEDVFNQLTVDNEERLLNTYLKFNEDASLVNVEKATSSYVIYSLNCDSITSDRKFIFMYNTDSKGRICFVRECELIDFIAGVDYTE